MSDAWDFLPETERTSDKTETFILFCEDEVSEPSYFTDLQKEKKVKINCVPNQKSDFRNYVNTIQYCIDHDLATTVNGATQLKRGITDHIWCVYDRDAENTPQTSLLPENNLRFTTAIQAAESAGLKVAWSNDVFELWILLHFEDIAPGIWQHRNYVYNRLTVIFRGLPGQSVEMQRVTQHARFNYKEAMKNRNNFIDFVRPLLESRRVDAISRAKAHDLAFTVGILLHDRNPCTRVYMLVEDILSFH